MKKFITMMTAAVLVLATHTGQAASKTWTGTAGATWDTGVTANWNGSTWADNDEATFGVLGAGTVVIDSAGVNANSLTFSVNGSSTPYTISGGALTLQAIATITATANGTISSAISGAGTSLTKAAAGTLTFSGSAANTYTGVTLIGNGRLALNKTAEVAAIPGDIAITNAGAPYLYMLTDNQLGGNGVLTFVGGGGNARVELGNTVQRVAGIVEANGAGVIQHQEGSAANPAGIGTLTLAGSDAYSFNGYLRNLNGVLSLIKTGAGTQTLSGGQISYTGSTTIHQGRLIYGGSAYLSTGTLTIDSGATLEVNPSAGCGNYNVALSGGGTYLKTGANLWDFNYNNGATKPVSLGSGALIDVEGGTLRLAYAGGNWASNLANLKIASGATFDMWDNTAGVFVNALTGEGTFIKGTGYNGGAGTLTVGVDNGSGTFSGILMNGTAGTPAVLSFTKSGAGTQTLTGTNTYTGATTINGGVLMVDGSISTSSVVTATSGGRLGGTGTIGGPVVANVGGGLAPGDGLGTTTVPSLSLSAGSVNTFEFNASTNDLIVVANSNGLTNNGTSFLMYSNGTANTWIPTLGSSYNLINYSGAIAGSGWFTAANPAPGFSYLFATNGTTVTLSVSAASAWTGGGADNNWTTGANWGAGAPPNGAALVFDTSTRTVNTNNYAVGSLFSILFAPTAGAFTLSGNSISLVGDVLNQSANAQTINAPLVLPTVRIFDTTNTAMAVNGGVSGAGGVTKAGTGTLTLAGSGVTYTGATTVNQGRLVLNNVATSWGNGGTVTLASGSALEFNMTGGWSPATTMSVSGTGTFIKSGAGMMDVTWNSVIGFVMNLNTNAAIRVEAGTLRFGYGSSSGNASWNNNKASLVVASGAVFDTWDYNLNPVFVDGLSGSGTVTHSSSGVGTLTVGAAGGSDTFSGIIANGTGLALTKMGAGTQTLTGVNTYTGATTVNGGALVVNGSLAAGSAVAVNAGGTLGGTGTVNGAISANTGATLSPGLGLGALRVGALTLNPGCTNVFEFDATPTNDLIVVANSNGLTNNGGVFLLYTAGTTNSWATPGAYTLMTCNGSIAGIGTLQVANPVPGLSYNFNMVGSLLQLTITSGASIWTGLGSDNFWQTTANWSGPSPMSGANLVFDTSTRLVNTNNFTAGSSFAILFTNTAGAFTLGGNAIALLSDLVNQSASAQTVNNDLTLGSGSRIISTVGPLALNGVLDGGGIVKAGTGTLSLTGANSYSGSTTVNSGVLQVNNSSGSGTGSGAVTVNAGGTLGGSGSISGAVTVNTDGVIAAGNGVGTLTGGSLTLAAGCTNIVEFNASSNDTVVLTGGLTNNGCAVLIYTNGTTGAWAQTGIYTLFQFNGTLGGVGLSAFTVANPVAGLTYTFMTNGAAVQLVVGGMPVWTGGGSDNNWQTAGNWGGVAPAAGSRLIFDTSTRPVNTNDFADGTPFSVLFTNTAGSFTLSGSAIALNGDVVNLSASPQTINNDLSFFGSGRTLTNLAGAMTLNGVISGNYGPTKAGTGTVTMTGANTYTGATTIAAGVLEVGGAGSLAGGNYPGAVPNAGQLRYTSTADQTISGLVSGTGALTMAGSNTLTLSGPSSYTGNTTVNSGRLILRNMATTWGFGSTVNIANGATLELNMTSAWSPATGMTVTGTGTFIKSGAGTMDVMWQNITGFIMNLSTNAAIRVEGGTLRFGWGTSHGNADWNNNKASLYVASGATVDIWDYAVNPVFVDALSGSGSVLSQYGMGTLTVGVAGGSDTFSGVISSGLSLAKAGTGTQTLTGTNTYTGVTTLAGGTLVLASTANQTLSGVISGSATLTQAGSGTVTLTGSNTYSGTISVTAGTLALGSTNVLSQAGTLMLAGGALDSGAYTNTAGALAVGVGSSTLLLGPGSLQFTNSSAVAWSGTLALSGTLGPQSLRFGTDRTGLNVGQLSMISYGGKRVGLDDQGYVVISSGFLMLVQ